MRVVVFLTLISCFALATLSHPSFATISHAACTNTTLSTEFNYVWVNDTEANQTTQTICPFECNDNSGLCNPAPFSSDATAMFYFLFPIISFILLYYANMLKKEDYPIHMFLMAVAMLFLILPLGVLAGVLPDPVANLYYLMIITFFILMFYYIMRVFIGSYSLMGGKKP